MRKIVYLMMGAMGVFGVFGARPALATGGYADCGWAASGSCPPTTNPTYTHRCTEVPPDNTGAVLCCTDKIQCNYQQSQTQTLENTWYNQDVNSFAKNVYEPAEMEMNSDRYAKYSIDSIAAALGVGAIGAPGQIAQGKNNSAVAQLGSAIAYMTSRPAVSGGEYLAYMGKKAGFIDQAYAQGAGFRGLTPILPIWVAFRNIAYLITSLMLVVIGFMIMLRKKIDAQTVIGVQQALPRIVVTLLLITFSYAIAGLVIDMIYFLIYLMIQVAITFGIYTANVYVDPISKEALGIKNILTQHSALGIGIKYLWWQKEGAVTAADAVGQLATDILGGVSGFNIGNILGQPIAYLILSVAILFAVFKLFFSLLMAYIQIILGTIIGPLQIMMGALPGSEAFGKWIRNLLANAAAFPATAGMFILGAALLGLDQTWGVSSGIGFIEDVTKGTGFSPPFINGNGAANSIQGLIGIGVILMTPKVVDMVKEALKAPEFKYGSAIGEAVGFGWSGARTGVSRGWAATRGYDEAIAQQIAEAKMRYIEMHGVAPTGVALDAITKRATPQAFGPKGERGWVRGRLSSLLGK